MKPKSKLEPWLFSGPALLIYGFVVVVPVILSFIQSAYKWDGVTSMNFVGLGNFIEMISDKTFFTAFTNNLVYAAVSVVYQFVIGMLLAIIFDNIIFARNVLKVMCFVPCVVSTVAISQIFMQLLAVSPMGVINVVIKALGMRATPFLAQQNTSLLSVALVDGYKYCGIYMVIFFSAFVAISQDIEDAAYIDGCKWYQQYLYIKIPMIRDVCQIALVMLLSGTLKAFEIPFVMTNGGPGASSELVSTYMYKMSFNAMKFGYGSMLSVFMFVECVIVVAALRRLLPESDY
jgi:raffinose/stachyose/melibiose transport system permease protein